MIFLATPAIWYPGQTEEEAQEEIDLMMLRADVTATFLKEEVDADFFLNFLHESGIDIFAASEEWNLNDGVIV